MEGLGNIHRFSLNLTPGQKAWLVSEAQNRGISQSAVIRHMFDAFMRASPLRICLHSFEHDGERF